MTEPTMQVLDGDECYRLLATQQIGRLGVNAEHYPLSYPANYVLDRDVIVIRTSAGVKLTAADHAGVTFEVDEIDQRRRSGWSVLVRGLAEEVTADHRAELVASTAGRARALAAALPQDTSDRRIVPGQLPHPSEDAAYP